MKKNFTQSDSMVLKWLLLFHFSASLSWKWFFFSVNSGGFVNALLDQIPFISVFPGINRNFEAPYEGLLLLVPY